MKAIVAVLLFISASAFAQQNIEVVKFVPVSFEPFVIVPLRNYDSDVIVNQTSHLAESGLNFTGTAYNMCFTPNNNQYSDAFGALYWKLGCENSFAFAPLWQQRTRCPAGNPTCLTGKSVLDDVTRIKFWYQNALGTVETGVNKYIDCAGFDVFVEAATNIKCGNNIGDLVESGYTDAAFNAAQTDTLYDAVLIFLKTYKERSGDILACGRNNATSSIPSRYADTEGKLDTAKLDADLRAMFDGYENHIVLGAYQGSHTPDSGAYTYGSLIALLNGVLSTSYPPKDLTDIYPPGTLIIAEYDGPAAKMIGINIKISDFQARTVGGRAGVLFHELLHNFGFEHGGNQPSDYTNDKAIVALEMCMRNAAASTVIIK